MEGPRFRAARRFHAYLFREVCASTFTPPASSVTAPPSRPSCTCDSQLVDFGLATVLSSPTYKVVEPVGSPGYAAPELLRVLPYDGQVDVFSLGVISFLLLSGAYGAADTLFSGSFLGYSKGMYFTSSFFADLRDKQWCCLCTSPTPPHRTHTHEFQCRIPSRPPPAQGPGVRATALTCQFLRRRRRQGRGVEGAGGGAFPASWPLPESSRLSPAYDVDGLHSCVFSGYLPFGGAASTAAEVVKETLDGKPMFDQVQWSAVSQVGLSEEVGVCCSQPLRLIYTFEEIGVSKRAGKSSQHLQVRTPARLPLIPAARTKKRNMFRELKSAVDSVSGHGASRLALPSPRREPEISSSRC